MAQNKLVEKFYPEARLLGYTFVDGTAGFHLNYIEVPLMLVGNITQNFNIYAGPYAAFLINGNVRLCSC